MSDLVADWPLNGAAALEFLFLLFLIFLLSPGPIVTMLTLCAVSMEEP